MQSAKQQQQIYEVVQRNIQGCSMSELLFIHVSISGRGGTPSQSGLLSEPQEASGTLAQL